MATVKELRLAGSQTTYSFIGKTWYGECTASETSQQKSVVISGFNASDLVAGTRIIVRFIFAQLYNGYPLLNVSGTGTKYIRAGNGYAGYREWQAYSTIAFVYDGSEWIIEDGDHATGDYWGRTKLSNAISNDATTALTPNAVYQANFQTQANLVTSVSSSSTDSQYPSAKLFYDTVGDIETLLASI